MPCWLKSNLPRFFLNELVHVAAEICLNIYVGLFLCLIYWYLSLVSLLTYPKFWLFCHLWTCLYVMCVGVSMFHFELYFSKWPWQPVFGPQKKRPGHFTKKCFKQVPFQCGLQSENGIFAQMHKYHCLFFSFTSTSQQKQKYTHACIHTYACIRTYRHACMHTYILHTSITGTNYTLITSINYKH